MAGMMKGVLGDITFQFNPTEMTIDGGIAWSNIVSAGNDPVAHAGSFNPSTIEFELWIYTKGFRPVDIQKQYDLLLQYRRSRTPIAFAFGSTAYEVIVLTCPINIKAWNKDASLRELAVPIKLQIVSSRVTASPRAAGMAYYAEPKSRR